MARNRNFIDGNRVLSAGVAVAAGSSDHNGSAIDTVDCENIVFIVTMGAIAANAVTSLKAQERASTTADWEDIANASIEIENDDDNETFILEVIKPLKRYVRAVVERGTANATVESGVAVLTHDRKEPVTHGTGVTAKKVVGS